MTLTEEQQKLVDMARTCADDVLIFMDSKGIDIQGGIVICIEVMVKCFRACDNSLTDVEALDEIIELTTTMKEAILKNGGL